MLLGDLTFLNYLGSWSRAHIARINTLKICVTQLDLDFR